MTPRSLFMIILRIIGLLFIKDLVTSVGDFATFFVYGLNRDSGTISATLLGLIFVIGIYVAVAWGLLFKTGHFVDKFGLDKGFDQEVIPVNIHRSTVISICLIVIGGTVLIYEIPILCRQLFAYYEQSASFGRQATSNSPYVVSSVVKVVIGVLLITEQRKIVNFIERKRITAEKNRPEPVE